jgi:circadian clock protein KaiB
MNPRASVARRFEKWFDRPPKRERYVLRLFIAGMTLRSSEAVARIKRLCEEHLQGRYELEIVDIYQQPELAKEYQIVAVPTLLKKSPLPARCLIGDLSNAELILRGLDIPVTR